MEGKFGGRKWYARDRLDELSPAVQFFLESELGTQSSLLRPAKNPLLTLGEKNSTKHASSKFKIRNRTALDLHALARGRLRAQAACHRQHHRWLSSRVPRTFIFLSRPTAGFTDANPELIIAAAPPVNRKWSSQAPYASVTGCARNSGAGAIIDLKYASSSTSMCGL
jgi:hypothetical protein